MANRSDKFLATSVIPGVLSQVVIFKGIQESGFDDVPSFSLYDLTADIVGHPKESTVTRNTLEKCGFILPPEAP